MQGHINGLPGSRAVLAEKATERIKCRGRICVQQGVAQPGLAHFANGQVLSLVAGVTEAHFPVPRLEVIPKFSHLATQTYVEELVPISEFLAPWTGVVEAAKADPRGHWDWYAINHQSVIPDCEGIERILDWHTNSCGAKERVSAGRMEWIGRKWHCRQRRIEIRPRIFEVGKYREVLVAQVAGERTVVHLTVCRWQVWSERSEVIEEVIATSSIFRAGLVNLLSWVVNTRCAWKC